MLLRLTNIIILVYFFILNRFYKQGFILGLNLINTMVEHTLLECEPL